MKAAPTTLTPVPPPVTTPTTPIPRHDLPPRLSRAAPPPKKRSGVLVGFFLFLVVGGGGGGGAYWYFMLGPGAKRSPVVTTIPAPAPVDSAPVPADTAANVDTTTRVVTPNPGAGRTTGSLSFTGVTTAFRVKVNGELVPDLQKPHEVDPGLKRIEVQAAGFQTWTGATAVKAGEDKVFAVGPMVRLPSAGGQPVAGGNRPAQPAAPTAPKNQCETPTKENYNADNSCFDTRPVALDGQFVSLPEGTTAWPTGNPRMSVIYVHVTAEGEAATVMGANPSNDPTFHVAAMRFARTTRYQPATKDGRSVAAWVQIPFRPKPQ